VQEPYEGCGEPGCDTTMVRREASTDRHSEVHTETTASAADLVKHTGGVVLKGTARSVTSRPWKGEVHGSHLIESRLGRAWTSGPVARVKTQKSRSVSPCSTNPRALDAEVTASGCIPAETREYLASG